MGIFGKDNYLNLLKSHNYQTTAKPLFTGSNPVAASISRLPSFLVAHLSGPALIFPSPGL
jgi:hypothetical protein